MITPSLTPLPKLPEISGAMSDEERRILILACHDDPVLFLGVFLEDWFPTPIPWFHRGILAIMLSKTKFLSRYGEVDKLVANFLFKEKPQEENGIELPLFHQQEGKIYLRSTNYIMLMLPRGFAKTTLVNACILYSILYELVDFTILLSESATHSETQLNSIKWQLEQNEKLRTVYGNLVPERQSSLKWTDRRVQATNQIVVHAAGRGGQVRGSLVNSKRPDLIVIDDVENQDSVLSPEVREKTRNWFYEAVVPALPMMNKNARIVMACTLLHREALASVLKRDPQWTTIVFGAYDREGNLLWAANMNERKLQRKRDSFALIGNLAGFYREYHNTLRHEDSQKFKPEYITIQRFPRQDFILLALALDPAISQKKGADYCSLAVVGLLPSGNINVVESYSKIGMTPKEQIDKFFELFTLWQPGLCGIESIAFQQALIFLMKEEMARRQQFFEVRPITHGKTDKLTRVEGVLQPRYAAGFITHRVSFPILEQQLYDWPSGKRDAPDAVAMAITLLGPLMGTAFDADTYMPELYQTLESTLINIEGAP